MSCANTAAAASAVGLICIKVFGCRGAQAGEYAVNLGLALQLTNILRDIRSDWLRGRLYLPLEDLRAFGCTEDALAMRHHDRAGAAATGSSMMQPSVEFYRRAAAALPVARSAEAGSR